MKEKKDTNKMNLIIIFSCVILMLTLLMSIGYAEIETVDLDINGTAISLGQSGVFISSVENTSSVGVNASLSTINDYSQTVLNSTVVLGSDSTSSVTYTITMMNSNTESYSFVGAVYDDNFYDNSNIIYELNGINEGDVLNAGGSKTFTITFKYAGVDVSNNTLNSYLNFRFAKIYSVAYANITSDAYPTTIVEGTTYRYTFTGTVPADISVKMGDTNLVKDTDYTYSDSVLTIPQVSGNLLITAVIQADYAELITEQTDDTGGATTDLQSIAAKDLVGKTFKYRDESNKTISSIKVEITYSKVNNANVNGQYIVGTLNINGQSLDGSQVTIQKNRVTNKTITIAEYTNLNISSENGFEFVIDYDKSNISSDFTVSSQKVTVTYVE